MIFAVLVPRPATGAFFCPRPGLSVGFAGLALGFEALRGRFAVTGFGVTSSAGEFAGRSEMGIVMLKISPVRLAAAVTTFIPRLGRECK